MVVSVYLPIGLYTQALLTSVWSKTICAWGKLSLPAPTPSTGATTLARHAIPIKSYMYCRAVRPVKVPTSMDVMALPYKYLCGIEGV